jgi:hypothetical protein
VGQDFCGSQVHRLDDPSLQATFCRVTKPVDEEIETAALRGMTSPSTPVSNGTDRPLLDTDRRHGLIGDLNLAPHWGCPRDCA